MNLLPPKTYIRVANIYDMQLNQLQSEILLSIKRLKADQQMDVLQYIGDLRQSDRRVKERLKNQALREIQQALRKEVAL